MSIEQLKSKFKRIVGISQHDLSDYQFRQIAEQVKKLSKFERTRIDNLQKIVKSVTGIDSFLIKESFDNSDIESLIDQIIDELTK